MAMDPAESQAKPPDRYWLHILAKLQAAKPALIANGSVVPRRRRGRPTAWVVRYRDRSSARLRQPSIYVGTLEYARRAMQLILAWREEAIPHELRNRELLRDLRQTVTMFNYSGRARKRVMRAARSTLDDYRQKLAFFFNWTADRTLRDGKRPGRPSKSGLW